MMLMFQNPVMFLLCGVTVNSESPGLHVISKFEQLTLISVHVYIETGTTTSYRKD
jgi:hypothetical protein